MSAPRTIIALWAMAPLLATACQEVGLHYDDPPPTAAIVSHGDGFEVARGSLVDLVGVVSEEGTDPDVLSARWYVDGEVACADAPLASDGTSRCAVTLDTEGNVLVAIEGSNLDGEAAVASLSLQVIDDTDPMATIAAPTDGSAHVAGRSVVLTGVVADAEDAPQDLRTWWESSLDGVLGTDAHPDTMGIVSGLGDLSAGIHGLTLWVEDAAGNVASDQIELHVDVENNVPSVTLSAPQSGHVAGEGTMVQFTAEVDDVEDEPSALDLVWESDRDGVFSTQGADSAGAATVLDAGLSLGTHVISVIATDAGGLFAVASTTLTINGGPSAPVVSVAPDPAHSTEDLVAIIDVPSVDPEGDPVTYTYAWEVDGLPSAASAAATLPAWATRGGDTWRVLVRANDTHGAGEMGYADAEVLNSPPAAQWVDLSGPDVTTNDILRAEAIGIDADGDSVTLTHTWTVDGVAVPGAALELDGAMFFDKHQTVVVEVVPHDGHAVGIPLVHAWTVDNAPPSAPVVSIDPSQPSADDDLLCLIDVPAIDADGDPITYTFDWEVDAAPFAAPVDTLEVGDTVLEADTANGETWTCNVTPHDGEEDGAGVSVDATVFDGWTCPNWWYDDTDHTVEGCWHMWLWSPPDGSPDLWCFTTPYGYNQSTCDSANSGCSTGGACYMWSSCTVDCPRAW